MTDLILFQSRDGEITLPVNIENETVWLTRHQMAELFDRDIKTIGKHINNAFKEELDMDSTVANFATVQTEGNRTVTRKERCYRFRPVILCS